MLFSFLVRYINLRGDPPAGDISRSGVFYVDEGTYAHNPVNKALFGKWFLENDYNAISNVPVFSFFQYLIIKIFGVGIAQVRLGGILYSVLSLLLLWLILRSYDRYAANIALILGATNFFFFIYNRLALLENLLLLFLIVITGFLFQYHRTKKITFLILAALFFVTGYFVKATIVFFVPVFFVTIFLAHDAWKIRLIHIFIFTTALFIFVAVWYYFWIVPHLADWNYFQHLNISQKFFTSPVQIFVNYARYFGNLKLFQFMPITYTIFLCYGGFCLKLLFDRQKIEFIDAYFLAWAICGVLCLGFFAYSPPRFSLILMPAIISLTARFFSKIRESGSLFTLGNRLVFIIGIGIICAAQISFGIFRIIRDQHHFLSCYLPWLSLLTLTFIFWSDAKTSITNSNLPLLVSILVLNLFQAGWYHLTIKHSYFDAIQDMQTIIAENPEATSVIAGDIAPFVATELQLKAINIIFRAETERERFLEHRPQFLILQDRNQLDSLHQKMPNFLGDVHLIKSYSILNNYVLHEDACLFKINVPPR